MAFDEELDCRVGEIAGAWGAVRKRMFGGTGYLIGGNMLAGVHKDSLILRLGPEAGDAMLADPRVRPFDITGRPMKGWVMVEPGEIDDDELVMWLIAAKEHAESLPAK